MSAIDFEGLRSRVDALSASFKAQTPFQWVRIDDLLNPAALDEIRREFPNVDTASWVDASGLHTKKKWTQPAVRGSVAETFYEEVSSPEFLQLLSKITGIKDILPDADLFGAGYHQTLDGGYLDVHIDFNYHDRIPLHRRLNLIVYLNKEWRPDWGGALELWDMEAKRRIAEVPPLDNVGVLFETNDKSFHGHPKPWNSGGAEPRRSLSTYYYTKSRDDGAQLSPHSTIYRNTEGRYGAFKTFRNGLRDLLRAGPLRRRLRS